MDRMSEYLGTLQGEDAVNIMKLVAQKFLTNVGCEPQDISKNIVAGSSFMNTSIYTKKMFDDIQKSYRIVSDSHGE